MPNSRPSELKRIALQDTRKQFLTSSGHAWPGATRLRINDLADNLARGEWMQTLHVAFKGIYCPKCGSFTHRGHCFICGYEHPKAPIPPSEVRREALYNHVTEGIAREPRRKQVFFPRKCQSRGMKCCIKIFIPTGSIQKFCQPCYTERRKHRNDVVWLREHTRGSK